jgi:hypothetical protein
MSEQNQLLIAACILEVEVVDRGEGSFEWLPVTQTKRKKLQHHGESNQGPHQRNNLGITTTKSTNICHRSEEPSVGPHALIKEVVALSF